jgi:hypothetical protein
MLYKKLTLLSAADSRTGLIHYDEIMEKGMPAQAGLLALVSEYVKWFEENFGTSFCKSITYKHQNRGFRVFRPSLNISPLG